MRSQYIERTYAPIWLDSYRHFIRWATSYRSKVRQFCVYRTWTGNNYHPESSDVSPICGNNEVFILFYDTWYLQPKLYSRYALFREECLFVYWVVSVGKWSCFSWIICSIDRLYHRSKKFCAPINVLARHGTLSLMVTDSRRAVTSMPLDVQ